MCRKRTEEKQKWTRLLMPLLLLTIILSGGFSVCALASDELPDPDRIGSITLTLTDDDTGEAISGGSIAVYRVADLVSGDTGYVWQYTENFSECTEALDNLESTDLVDYLVSYAGEKELEATEIPIDSEGTALYDNASVGLYLIVQTQAADGYEAFLPFLVSVPYKNSSGWVYDVDASPKIEPPTATETETESSSEGETEPETGAQSESGSETEPESESGTQSESGSESESGSGTQSESGSESESESGTQSESGSESESGSGTESESGSGTELESEGATESENGGTEAETVNETEAETAKGAESESETESETLPQTGRLIWPIPVLAALGVLLIAAGRFLSAAERK